MNGCPSRSTKYGNAASRSESGTSRPSPPEATSASFRMRARMLEEQLLRDAATVGVTDQIHVVEVQRLEPRAHDVGMPLEGVARVGALG